jgi:hypothetical protein
MVTLGMYDVLWRLTIPASMIYEVSPHTRRPIGYNNSRLVLDTINAMDFVIVTIRNELQACVGSCTSTWHSIMGVPW